MAKIHVLDSSIGSAMAWYSDLIGKVWGLNPGKGDRFFAMNVYSRGGHTFYVVGIKVPPKNWQAQKYVQKGLAGKTWFRKTYHWAN